MIKSQFHQKRKFTERKSFFKHSLFACPSSSKANHHYITLSIDILFVLPFICVYYKIMIMIIIIINDMIVITEEKMQWWFKSWLVGRRSCVGTQGRSVDYKRSSGSSLQQPHNFVQLSTSTIQQPTGVLLVSVGFLFNIFRYLEKNFVIIFKKF